MTLDLEAIRERLELEAGMPLGWPDASDLLAEVERLQREVERLRKVETAAREVVYTFDQRDGIDLVALRAALDTPSEEGEG